MRGKETANVKKYIRSERPNLFEPNDYISMVVTLSGTISQEEMEQAVRKAYANNEATSSKIVLEADGSAYYESLEESGCKVFFDSRNCWEILKENEKCPFDLKNGELIRAFIIEEEQGMTMLLMAHHLAGDGMSMLYFIEDILLALNGKELTYKPMILLNREYLRKKARLPFAITLFVKKANRSWKKQGKIFTWEDYEAIHHTYWESHSSEIMVQSYNLNELKKDCPKGVTLNSYLIAILLRKFPESRAIGIPVSVRDGNYSMSNQTSGVAVKHRYNTRFSLVENTVQIQKKIKRQLGNKNIKYFVLLLMEQLAPTLIDAVLMHTHSYYQNALVEKMSEILGYTGENGRDLGITNLMKVQFSGKYQKFQITDILFIPPKVSYTKQVVGIVTFGEMLHIVYHNMKETYR